MEVYTEFAKVYDEFMEDVPYDRWCDFLSEYLTENGIEDGLVLDLGCGTGSLTRLLSGRGYDMIGVDASVDMLDMAKNYDNNDILYIAQDMRELELYGTVRAVVSSCDCINYITESKELQQVFSLVNNYLDTKGLFIFDFNSKYKYEQLGSCVIAENKDDASFIWENFYYEEENINEYDVTFFIREENDLYRKVVEEHYQRAYTLDEIKELIADSGMEYVAAFDNYTIKPATEHSERICVVARESGK